MLLRCWSSKEAGYLDFKLPFVVSWSGKLFSLSRSLFLLQRSLFFALRVVRRWAAEAAQAVTAKPQRRCFQRRKTATKPIAETSAIAGRPHAIALHVATYDLIASMVWKIAVIIR